MHIFGMDQDPTHVLHPLTPCLFPEKMDTTIDSSIFLFYGGVLDSAGGVATSDPFDGSSDDCRNPSSVSLL